MLSVFLPINQYLWGNDTLQGDIGMHSTIDYYNLNAKNFIENTQNVDMHLAQDRFLRLLDENATILDFGCSSGRDTKYFLEKGYHVTATDGSAKKYAASV